MKGDDTTKRKKFAIITSMFTIVVLCLAYKLITYRQKYNTNNYIKSKYENLTNEEIIYEVLTNDPRHTSKKLKYKFTNQKEKTIGFGQEYKLEIKLDGEWYTVPEKLPLEWDAILHHLDPAQSYEGIIDLNMFALPGHGSYRIVKEIDQEELFTVEFYLK